MIGQFENIFEYVFLNENHNILIQIHPSHRSTLQYIATGVGNGLMSNRQQTINWADVDLRSLTTMS